jgi:PAS domain S-box-containing protein
MSGRESSSRPVRRRRECGEGAAKNACRTRAQTKEAAMTAHNPPDFFPETLPLRGGRLASMLMDQLEGDIIVLDADGVILDMGRQALESRGLKLRDVIGKQCRELAPTKRLCNAHAEDCAFLEAKRTGKRASQVFTRMLDGGRVRYMRAACYPVIESTDEPDIFLYVCRDVTAEQQLEKHHRQTEKMAAIGELCMYMAHEIRNPLFSIGGFANALLRNASLNDLAREKARIIYDESRRLEVILTNMLNFARPTLQPSTAFDVATTARQTLELLTLGCEERHINVILEVERQIPHAAGNAENLKQSLINIVKNAFEAMPDGGILTLSLKRNRDYVQIDVSDTGTGIPEDKQPQVFNPFFTTKQRAGLGLAMARKVIEEMHGSVSLESVHGRGTCVSIMLPVADASDEALAPDGQPEPSAAYGAASR